MYDTPNSRQEIGEVVESAATRWSSCSIKGVSCFNSSKKQLKWWKNIDEPKIYDAVDNPEAKLGKAAMDDEMTRMERGSW